jgi:hypothetical protein
LPYRCVAVVGGIELDANAMGKAQAPHCPSLHVETRAPTVIRSMRHTPLGILGPSACIGGARRAGWDGQHYTARAQTMHGQSNASPATQQVVVALHPGSPRNAHVRT